MVFFGNKEVINAILVFCVSLEAPLDSVYGEFCGIFRRFCKISEAILKLQVKIPEQRGLVHPQAEDQALCTDLKVPP